MKKPTSYAAVLLLTFLLTSLIGPYQGIEALAIAASSPNRLMGEVIGNTPLASQAAVTVDETQPTNEQLPPDFIGLSYEARDDLFSSDKLTTQGNLPALLSTLSSNGNLRIGGSTVDWLSPYPNKNMEPLSQLALLTQKTNWEVELAVNLASLVQKKISLNDYTSLISQEASDASNLLGPHLKAFVCGNEPQYYGAKPSYHYAVYLGYFDDCKKAIRQKAPASAVAGPDVLTTDGDSLKWITNFIRDEHSSVSMITQHLYPIGWKTGSTIQDLLSSQTDSSEIDAISNTVSSAATHNLPLRLDETNSALHGGIDGISNVYASALWAVDYMLLMAEHGVAGVNFHGKLAVCESPKAHAKYHYYYTPLCATSVADEQNHIFTPQPIYYGMLFINLVGTGKFLPVTVSSPNNNITAYALQGSDGKTRVVLVEKDDSSKRPVNVTLKAGTSSGYAQVITLTGSSLTGRQGVKIQGARVDRDGHFTSGSPDRIRGNNGTYTINLKSGSAALITLS
jgi:hypothetical protein